MKIHDIQPDEPLNAYVLSVASLPPIGSVPLLNAVHQIENVWSVIWHRDGQFQTQLFIAPPNCIIPEHTHPNVDSYECYVGGQIRFSHSGKWVSPKEMFTSADNGGTAVERGELIRVKPNDWHGGVFGPGGGVFLSLQHWLNGVKPHCVAADYVGAVMGEKHFAQVVYGSPKLQPSLTWVDAAPKEQGF
mgnify:CR=1 FL=1